MHMTRFKDPTEAGRLLRHGGNAVLIGFTTYSGTVTAASEWDSPAERKTVRPALENSYERLFHQTGIPRFMLDLRDPGLSSELPGENLERAIGAIYRPESERISHYFRARLAQQFDAVLHFDATSALATLEPESRPGAEPRETFPSGV